MHAATTCLHQWFILLDYLLVFIPQQQATSAKTMTKGAKDNNAGSRAIIITVMIPTAKGLSPISAMTTVTVFESEAMSKGCSSFSYAYFCL